MTWGQAQTLLNLGNVLTLQRDWEQARTCFDSGLILAQALGAADLEGQLRTGLGDWLVAQHHLDEALAELQHALALKETAGEAHSAETYVAIARRSLSSATTLDRSTSGLSASATGRARASRLPP